VQLLQDDGQATHTSSPHHRAHIHIHTPTLDGWRLVLVGFWWTSRTSASDRKGRNVGSSSAQPAFVFSSRVVIALHRGGRSLDIPVWLGWHALRCRFGLGPQCEVDHLEKQGWEAYSWVLAAWFVFASGMIPSRDGGAIPRFRCCS